MAKIITPTVIEAAFVTEIIGLNRRQCYNCCLCKGSIHNGARGVRVLMSSKDPSIHESNWYYEYAHNKCFTVLSVSVKLHGQHQV